MSLAARRRGHIAEFLCLWHLRLRGWRTLARRFKVKSGRIDLIDRKGRVPAAIEVKARDTSSAASEAISPQQRRRGARALDHFFGTPSGAAALGCALRRDAGDARRLPRHVVDTWRETF